MNDQTKKIYIILLITFHHCTIEKFKAKIVDLVTWTYWYWNWFWLGQLSRELNKTFNYSFKAFLCFGLAKITRIIHQNQLLLTKFGRVLPYWTDDVKSEAKLQIIKPLNQENLGRVWINGRTFFTANYYLYVLNRFYVISMEFLSLSRRCPSSRNVPQRQGARKTVCFLRLPHSIIAKYVSCRSSKLRDSLNQAIRVNVVQVKPLVRYFRVLVKKPVSIMFFLPLFLC